MVWIDATSAGGKQHSGIAVPCVAVTYRTKTKDCGCACAAPGRGCVGGGLGRGVCLVCVGCCYRMQ